MRPCSLQLAAVVALSLTDCTGRALVQPDGASPTDAGDALDTVDLVDTAVVDVAPIPDARAASAPLVQWVNPFMGTGGQGFGTGTTFPGPQTPFGMARPGPDTADPDGTPNFSHCSGYSHGDRLVQGFSMTRMNGTGISDYGAIALMPTIGMTAEKTRQTGYRTHIDHTMESASPGFYRTHLPDTDIDVELTATDHVGLQRFTFPAASDGVVILDLGHTIGDVRIDRAHLDRNVATGEITGSARFVGGYSDRFGGVAVYFAMRTSRAAASVGTFADGVLNDNGVTTDVPSSGAYLHFDTNTSRTVTVAVALSFVDADHARANLDAEAAALDFDAVRTATEARWERALSVVHISGRSEDEFRTFYSALYHTLLMPTLATESDGTYRGIDGTVHTATGFRYYTDLSLWDTFRTEHPMLALLYPEYQLDFARSLVAMTRDAGYLPRWPLGTGETGGMLGDSVDIVLADSWIKGIRDYDLASVYPRLRANALAPAADGVPSGRGGVETYVARGYVTMEAGGRSVSETLEYAYDDFALAQLADAVGESADATMFRAHAGNWRNLFDPATKFILGRHEDGHFETITNDTVWQEYYAEGNAWHYNFYAPHDVEGMATAFGGRDAMRARLDMLFTQTQRRGTSTFLPLPYYWPGNEPCIHTPWLYAALDDGASAARWTHWIANSFYNSTPTGLPGNDDGGTMSAWYVFAALGIFPVAATPDYLIASPMLTHAEITLATGTLVIDAPDSSTRTFVPRSVRWNDAALARPRITHAQLTGGGTLRFELE